MYLYKCSKCNLTVESISEKGAFCSKCDTEMINLGKEIDLKQMRVLAGLSQNSVGKAVGITKNYVSMLENNKVPIPKKIEDRLRKLYLSVSPRSV